MAHAEVVVFGATRPCQGETENGDAWQVDRRDEACRIALIDALGHGPVAAEEAEDARRALAVTGSFAPHDGLRACHAALAGGRGAAISIAHVDPVAGRLVFAGIGNVEGIFWTEDREQRLSPDRGIVGAVSRTLHPLTIELEKSWLLLLHTDGVSSRFRLADLLSAPAPTPQGLADTVLQGWGRPQDDATVVVACPGDMLPRPRPAPSPAGRGLR